MAKEDELLKQIEEYKKQTKSLTDQVNGLKGTIAKSDKESIKETG